MKIHKLFIISILLGSFIVANVFIKKDSQLNEAWIVDTNNEHKEWIFNPDKTFEYKAHHNTFDFYSGAHGTYFYNKKTNEIFLSAQSGYIDYPQDEIDGEPLYYSTIYDNFQFYFKIKNHDNFTVEVFEYINLYHENFPESDVLKNDVWKEKNGLYQFIGNQKHLLEFTYTINETE